MDKDDDKYWNSLLEYVDNMYPYEDPYLDEPTGKRSEKIAIKKKCECGSAKVFRGEKIPHSHWCPKY